jgi:hypothetical protein
VHALLSRSHNATEVIQTHLQSTWSRFARSPSHALTCPPLLQVLDRPCFSEDLHRRVRNISLCAICKKHLTLGEPHHTTQRARSHFAHILARTCAHTRTHALTQPRTHACAHARTHTRTHARTHIVQCTHARTHVRTQTRTNACMHVRTHPCTCKRTHMRTYATADVLPCERAHSTFPLTFVCIILVCLLAHRWCLTTQFDHSFFDHFIEPDCGTSNDARSALRNSAVFDHLYLF